MVIFVLTLLFKLGPAYASFWTLKSIMNNIAQSPEPIQGGRSAVLRLLESRLNVNDVRAVELSAFSVKKAGEDSFDLSVEYEQREHLFFNIDVVLSFDHAVVVKGR
jgi:hypothetical protein